MVRWTVTIDVNVLTIELVCVSQQHGARHAYLVGNSLYLNNVADTRTLNSYYLPRTFVIFNTMLSK